MLINVIDTIYKNSKIKYLEQNDSIKDLIVDEKLSSREHVNEK